MGKNIILLLLMLLTLAILPRANAAERTLEITLNETFELEQQGVLYMGKGPSYGVLTLSIYKKDDSQNSMEAYTLSQEQFGFSNNRTLEIVNNHQVYMYASLREFEWSNSGFFPATVIYQSNRRVRGLQSLTIPAAEMAEFEEYLGYLMLDFYQILIDLRVKPLGMHIDLNKPKISYEDLKCSKKSKILKCKKIMTVKYNILD